MARKNHSFRYPRFFCSVSQPRQVGPIPNNQVFQIWEPLAAPGVCRPRGYIQFLEDQVSRVALEASDSGDQAQPLFHLRLSLVRPGIGTGGTGSGPKVAPPGGMMSRSAFSTWSQVNS